MNTKDLKQENKTVQENGIIKITNTVCKNNIKELNLRLFVLKIIAVISMVIDHAVKLDMIHNLPVYVYIGRSSYVLFAYLIIKGYLFSLNSNNVTQNIINNSNHNFLYSNDKISKYKKRLLIMGLISIIPHFLYVFIVNTTRINYFIPFQLNILFTLYLSICLLEEYIKKSKNYKRYILIIFASLFVEYSIYGVILPLMFYYFEKKYCEDIYKIELKNIVKIIISYVGITFLFSIIGAVHSEQIMGAMAILLISFFTINKYIFVNLKIYKILQLSFYLFYPLHFLLLLLCFYVINFIY